MTDSNDVVVRDFRRDDLEAVLALRASVFPGLDLPRERRRWTWEFDENPARDPAVPDSWILEHEGKVVGNYGLLPSRFAVGGRTIQAFAGIDFAVDPSMQGRGLGHVIAKRFMAIDGFPYITSPTPATCHLMQKYGGEVIVGAEEPSLWVYPLHAGRPDPSTSDEVEVSEITEFDTRFDALFAAVGRDLPLVNVRDAAYLNWRYRDYPFGKPTMLQATHRGTGDLRGFAVFQHDPNLNQGYVLELWTAPEDRATTGSLLAGAVAAARRVDIAELYTRNRLAPMQASLEANQFHRVDGHPLQFVCRVADLEVRSQDWYITTGDGDILFGVGDL